MYEVTEFYIQPPSGSAIKFRDGDQAAREAQRLGRRKGPVMLFSVRGWPRYDLWDAPKLIGEYGPSRLSPS